MQKLLRRLNTAVKLALLLSPLWVFSASLSAIEVTQLDQASVDLDDRSPAQKNKAIEQAFDKVILKNSGLQTALNNPQILAKRRQPKDLITQYGYQVHEGQLSLKVNFDKRQIVNLLRSANLPVWGEQRPLTLVWLVADDGYGQKQIINDLTKSEIKQAFSRQATDRGMPFIFPLMDLDDAMQISINDIRGMFVDNVAAASGRYQTDFFIMAEITQQDDHSQYRLNLYPSRAAKSTSVPLISLDAEAKDVNTAISAMMASVSEYYVEQYAVIDSGTELATTVAFSGIDQMQKLVALERYIDQLSAIKSAQLLAIKGDTVLYRFSLFGTQEELFRVMDLSPKLTPVTQAKQASVFNRSGSTQNNAIMNTGNNTGNIDQAVSRYQWRGR